MASENPKPINGAESLSRMGVEMLIFSSWEMFGWFSNTDPGHSRPAAKCSLQGAQCWLETETQTVLRLPGGSACAGLYHSADEHLSSYLLTYLGAVTET